MDAIKRIISWISNSVNSENYKNWKVVVLCVIAATTFWFFNALNKNDYNTIIKYPIELTYDNPNDSLIVMQPPPGNLSINVSGRGWILFRKTFWFGIDPVLINIPSPVDTKFLTSGSLLPFVQQALNELEVIDVVDDSIFFNIENRISKTVMLEVDSMMLDLETDYQLISSIQIVPDSLQISGPSSVINTLPDKLPIFINENEIDASFDKELDANVLEIEGVSYFPENINIKFEVSKFDKITSSFPITYLNMPEGFPKQRDSSIIIEYWKLDDNSVVLDSLSFSVVADYAQVKPRDSTLRLEVIANSDLFRLIDYSPRQVTLSNE